MKRSSICIKLLIVAIIAIPIVIYFLANRIDRVQLEKVYEKAFEKFGFSQTSIKKETINDKSRFANKYSIGETGDYTWGSFEVLYSNWAVPYTVTQEQYGYDSPLVGYCCYLGWPTVKSATSAYMNDIDEQGTDHAYPSWVNGLRLANKDGHRQRIECEKEATFSNLSKAIAYAESGLNGKYSNGDIQNLIWNSHIWVKYGADSVVEGNLGSATSIDTIGGVSYHYVGDANTSRLVRAQQFATWAYQVLGNDGELNLKITPQKEEEKEQDGDKQIHVEADQATLSYLVGPFKLDLTLTEGGNPINDEITAAGTGRQTLGDFLYKEMTLQNFAETSENVFIKTRFIIHAEFTDEHGAPYTEEVEVRRKEDGTIDKQEESAKTKERMVITDEYGAALEYGLPEFGKEFYIKYYLTNDLAKKYNLKYIQPEIKTSYLNNAMTAGGIKEHSVKVSYSVHYSVCNEQNAAVNSYIRNKGYEEMSLGDSDDGGYLKEAFFYSKANQGKTADLQEGIDGLVEMVAHSNQGGKATVTWYDDTYGGWDSMEQFYGDQWDRCDGVFLDECDTEFSFGGGITYEHNNYFFECEYDTVDEFYDSCIHNYILPVTVRTGTAGEDFTSVRADIEEHTHEQLYTETHVANYFYYTWLDPDDFTRTECGCEDHDCECCNTGCGDCGCDDGDDSTSDDCSCGCGCKYRYNASTLQLFNQIFCRDKRPDARTEYIKRIKPTEAGFLDINIPASGYIYNSAAAARNALAKLINDKIDEQREKNLEEFKTWYYQHAWPALYVPFSGENVAYSLPFVEEEQTMMQKVIYNIHAERSSGWVDKNFLLPKKEINEYLGGNVSENEKGIVSTDDAQKDEVWQGAGVEVTLIDLGVQLAEPVPPTPPIPPGEVPVVPEPVKPPDEDPEPKRDTYEWEVPRDSEMQAGGQCAMYGIANLIRSAGIEVTPTEVLDWMVREGHYKMGYGGTYEDPKDYYYPSRADCIAFAQQYISEHADQATGTSNINVEAFYDDTRPGNMGYYVSADYIMNNLPQNIGGETQWNHPDQEYEALQVCYFGSNNPGVNTASNSHYVVFNEWRQDESGNLQVYCLNSGQGQTSGWINWNDLNEMYKGKGTNGQGSIGAVDPNNIHDYGAIKIKYKVEEGTDSGEWESMSEEEFNRLHDEWLVKHYEYEEAMKEYNKAMEDYEYYINNILPGGQAAQTAYEQALKKYEDELKKYNAEVAAWAGGVQKPKVVQVTVTDENGNYGFQRLNPMHTYTIQFRYDGLEYIAELADPISDGETTEIADDIQKRIAAYEIDVYNEEKFENDPREILQGREEVNDMFENIDASNNNYHGNHGDNKAYGWYTKLRGSGAEFYSHTAELENEGDLDNNTEAMRYVDAYHEFKKLAIEKRKVFDQNDIKGMYLTYDNIETTADITYDDILRELPGKLGNADTDLEEGNDSHNLGESNSLDSYNEGEQICNFINDSLLIAKTKLNFPDEKPVKFFLEDIGTGKTEDENNRNDANSDSHNNYHHIVCDDPFPVLEGTSPRDVNALYNQNNSGDSQTIRNRDQARNIDYSIQRRDGAELAIAMDLEAVTLLVNGQREVYKYGELGLNEDNVEEFAQVSNRVSNEFQNYKKNYSRIITESMYLYDGKIADDSSGDVRDLSMFVTYKIVVKNTSENKDLKIDVGYIVDHFDAFYLKWDPNDQYRVRSIVNNPEYYTAEVTVNDDKGGSHPYDADKKSLAANGIANMYNEVFISVGSLNSGEAKTMTITFEQTKDKYGRLNINQNLDSGALLVGDKNVVEIDGYSTSENDVFRRGLVTRHSNIGNLCPVDFYGAGNKAGSLKDDIGDHVENRVEIDTANAPNIIIYIPPEGFIPCISGYTFEDVRNKESSAAVIGNGEFDTSDEDKKGSGDKDKKIAGLTVELVEYIREVDQNGLTSGANDSYIKEKIWGSITYPMDGSDSDQRIQPVSQINVPKSYEPGYETHHRYYSGSGSSQIMMDVESGYLKVSSRKDENGGSYINIGEGEYKFVNVPPGDFVVRFIYGDTTQTVLSNDSTNEVNNLLATNSTIPLGNVTSDISYTNPNDDNYMFLNDGSDGYVGNIGLNSKSYNGNDFKSTIYQSGLEQNTSYEGINGYTDYNRQNYTQNDGISMTQVGNGDLLNKLYYYDITIGDDAEDVSDAKDIYAFRQNSDNYAKGYISALTGDLYRDHLKAQNETFTTSSYTMIEELETETLPDGTTVYVPRFNNSMTETKGENPITLRNYRNEIMNSFEQIGTYTSSNSRPERVADNETRLDANRQVEMLKELMKYTRIVAQTGIINFEVEYTIEDWANTHGVDQEYIMQTQINSAPGNPSDNYFKGDRNKHFHIRNLNLGLVQRPEAQIRLNKNAANVKIALSSGETLFDTSKSVNNLYFAVHKNHTYKINSRRLQSVNVTTNSLTSPELIQAYMDDELIENATLQIKYVYTFENIGEVDYLDKKFYYTGKEERPDDLTNISRTNIDEVLDYVPNNINFESEISNTQDELRVKNVEATELNSGFDKSYWQVKAIIPEGGSEGQLRDSKEYYETYIYPFGVQQMDAEREQTPIGGTTPGTLSNEYLWGSPYAGNLNADLVNREFFDRVNTYDTIISTDRLSTKKYRTDNYYSIQISNGTAYTFGLLPKSYNTSKEEYYKIETPVVLSVVMSQNEDLVFPNLVEAVRISNSVGRRCTYSTVGNQPMANQHSGIDVSSEETKDTLLDKYSTYNPVDVVTPIEIDADSSQNVRILPPTGFNKNNSNLYFALIGALSIIIVSIFMIKVGFGQRRKERSSDISRWK